MSSHRETQAGAAHPDVRRYLNIKRRATGDERAVAVEGLWALRHATAGGACVDTVFVCPELVRGPDTDTFVARATSSGCAVRRVSERVLRRMVDRDGPDGVAAIVRLRPCTLRDVPVRESTRVVILDEVEMAGNVGAIIRCADGAGADAVILTGHRVRLSNPQLIKASMGTMFSMRIIAASPGEVLRWITSCGLRSIAADPSATTSYRDADYSGPVAIVLGSERRGLGGEWRAAADLLVAIPMYGVADSLNIGHAAAILLYESLR